MNWEKNILHYKGKWNEPIGKSAYTKECLGKRP